MSAVPTVAQVLTALVEQAAAAAGHGDERAELALPTGNAAHGDYQSNHAFRLAKARKMNPRAMAESIKAALPAHPAVKSVSVAGPGFLNFTLDDAWLAAHLAAQVSEAKGGIPQTGEGSTVVIDYSSPNVAKRMHVGHMRSTIIGSALYRLHQAAGYHVVGDNHIGDWGTQFGKLIVAWRTWLDEDAYVRDPIGELERLYVLMGERMKEDPALEAQARAETVKLQQGDPENRALWTQFIDVSLQEFNAIYARLGVHFDETLGESAYNDELAGLVDELLEKGVAEISNGAAVIKFTEADGKGLADTLLIVRKADGAFLYGTTDLATVRYRIRRWRPSRIVYVTDTRQQLHFRQFFVGAQKMGWTEPELVHAWFGMLKLPEGLMSTRKGNVIRLVDLIDEAVRRARAVVDQKSPELSEQERAEIAEAVGVGAVRYADLSQNPQSDITFDWDRMLSLEGNTAPFLMYSYARCRSLQRKGGITSPDVVDLAVSHPLERELLLALLRFPESVIVALENSRANLLCDHLFQLAGSFNRFYYELDVLGAETEALKRSRLALVEASARVLGRGLALLGVPALDRM